MSNLFNHGFPILPEYYIFTEHMTDEEILYFNRAISCYMADNLGDTEYYVAQLNNGNWQNADKYINLLDEYFKKEPDPDAEQDS